MTGETPEALINQAELPEEAEYVWQWFLRLSAKRQVGMGACPIAWDQIKAFFDLIGVRPLDWELQAIELLDNVWLGSVTTEQAG